MTAPHTVELRVTREFDAPRALVYRAFVDPDQLAAWFGPVGWSVPRETVESDVRVGGRQRFVMAADDGSARSTLDTTFVEVVENELIVGTQALPDGVPSPGGATSMTLRLEFSDAGEGRTRLDLTQAPYAPEWESMARMGWGSSFTKLDTLVATSGVQA